jgi:hypothetical protein
MSLAQTNIDLNKELSKTYHELPDDIVLIVRDELCKELSWSRPTFYSRTSGQRFILKHEVPVIREIFKKYGFDIFIETNQENSLSYL